MKYLHNIAALVMTFSAPTVESPTGNPCSGFPSAPPIVTCDDPNPGLVAAANQAWWAARAAAIADCTACNTSALSNYLSCQEFVQATGGMVTFGGGTISSCATEYQTARARCTCKLTLASLTANAAFQVAMKEACQ